MPNLPFSNANWVDEISGLAGNSRSAYAAMLKDQYLDMWDEWLNSDSSVLAKRISKELGTMFGQKALSAAALTLPQSAGMAGGEGYPLPYPTRGSEVNLRLLARDTYTRLRQTGQVRRAARRGKKAAWADPLAFDTKQARKQSGLNKARHMYNGYADVLAKVKSFATPVVTLYGRDDRTSGAVTASNYFKFGAHYLRNNMMVGFTATVHGATHNDHNNVTNMIQVSAISNSDPDNPTLTLLGGIAGGTAITTLDDSIAADDLMVAYGSRNDTMQSDERQDADHFTCNGLYSVLQPSGDVGYLYGQSKTTYAGLAGILDRESTEAARDFSEMRLALLKDRIRNEGNGSDISDTIGHDSVIREVANENRGDRRFAPIQRESGYGQLTHTAGDVMTPYVADWLCPPGRLNCIDKSHWGKYTESKLAPLENSGRRWVADYDQDEVILHNSGNIACTVPGAQGAMDDLAYNTRDVPGA